MTLQDKQALVVVIALTAKTARRTSPISYGHIPAKAIGHRLDFQPQDSANDIQTPHIHPHARSLNRYDRRTFSGDSPGPTFIG
jgi:hypothetical protein